MRVTGALCAGVRAAWDYAAVAYPEGASVKTLFYNQPKTVWAVSGRDYDSDLGPAGYARCLSQPMLNGDARRFCYVVIRNAGHEAAAFEPRSSYDMNQRFLHHLAFNGSSSMPVPGCAPCGGSPPFAGSNAPGCRSG